MLRPSSWYGACLPNIAWYICCEPHPDYPELLAQLISISVWLESVGCTPRGLVGFVLFLQFTQNVVCSI